MKLRTHLVLLVVATALPLMLLAAGLIVYSARLEHDLVQRGMRDTARALALALDRDIRDVETAVQTLAASRYLDDPADLRRFYGDAQVVSSSIGGWAVLSDPSGRQVLNTSRPFGESLPLPTASSLAMMQSVATERRPFVSNVFIGTVSRLPAVIIAVPVIRSDRVLYVLDFPLDPARFSQLLRDAALAHDWSAVITDRAGGVVAMIPVQEGVVGRPATALWRERTQGPGEGLVKGAVLSDAEVYAAHTRSKESGWVVGVAAPVRIVEKPFWRALRTLVIGGLALVGLALGLAYLLSQRIAAPIGALARSLRSGPGSTGSRPSPGPVAEVNELQRALDEGEVRARLLAAETSARERAELRAVEQEAARGEAEAANRAKDVFLAILSHELRTPINAMMGWIQMLRSGHLDQAQSGRALEVLERNATHQARLITDLLDVSRIVTGRLALETEVVDWPGLVAGAVESARPAAEAKALTLTARLDPVAGPVRGDPERLRQVVGNILANAIKFTPEGGAVEARLVRDGDARLTVTDTGRGIDLEFLPHVFERFRQADDPGAVSRAGLGLGLSIVRHLVEAHGGKVSAHSDGIGKGATITVELPLVTTAHA